MSSFSAAETRKPPSFVVVPPSAFVETWDERPTSPVAIGLRTVAFTDLQAARAQATEKANESHRNVDLVNGDSLNAQQWADAFHDALMLWVVVRGMCDPNDARSGWKPFAAAPEDMARDYLTAEGVKLIFDAWERMRISTDPTQRELGPDEHEALFEAIRERLPNAVPVRAMRVRRLLAFCLDEIKGVLTTSEREALAAQTKP